MTPTLTDAGRNLMLRALTGDTIHFTEIQLGSGARPDPAKATSLQSMKLNLAISELSVGDNYATLSTLFSNSTVTVGFRITEAGFFAENPDNPAQSILYAYGTEDSATADYVPASSNRILEMQFDAFLFIGDAENVTAAINSSLVYASASEFNAHVANANNPHTVTKAQVGLGNVPNVATNDQTPTFTQNATLTNITSGEKVNSIFGKIMRAIADLISHIANKQNPHTVTLAQVGGAAVSHTHDASNIASGALPVNRGGTGATSLTTGGILKGNSTGAFTALTGIGALYADSAGSPVFGTLPVNRGGTGATSLNTLASQIASNLQCAGTYIGNGETIRYIDVGFVPRAVLVTTNTGIMQSDTGEHLGGFAVTNSDAVTDFHGAKKVVTIGTANGFAVFHAPTNGVYANTLKTRYNYIAFR